MGHRNCNRIGRKSRSWAGLILVSALLVMILLVGCSSGGDDDGDNQDACAMINLPSRGYKIINSETCGGLNQAAVVRVAVVFRRPDGVFASPVCTGTMISNDDVLTATHCVDMFDFAGYPVVGAGIIIGDRNDERFIEAVGVHQAPGFSFNGERTFNDAAVISLAQSPGLNVLPILASSEPSEGEAVYVYGYGKREEGTESEEDLFFDLQGGRMTLGSVTPNHYFVRYDGSGVNVCNGDSGGPMVYIDNGVPAIVGVVSQGSVEGCRSGDVTTFTNVTSSGLLGWLSSVVPDLAVH